MRRFAALLLTLGIATAWANDKDAEAVAQAIHSNIETTRDIRTQARTIGGLSIAQAIAKFYEARAYAPAWSNAEVTRQLFAELDDLRNDGLEPEDYRLSRLRSHFAQMPAPDISSPAAVRERADFDVSATKAYLLSLAHLFRGKVNPATLEPEWNFARNDLALSEAMNAVNAGIAKRDLHAVYERARPQYAPYRQTRVALAAFRLIAAQGGWPRIDTRTVLKPGMSDPQITHLRRRLLPSSVESPASTDVSAAPDVYDDTLVAAVKKFQREQYLVVDGIVGPATRAALNVAIEQRIDQVRVNLERGRWLFNELHDDFVLVDIAGYKIYFFRHGQLVWKSLVQVGRPARQSPIFKAKITYITFNPTWTVPPTILRKDILPKLKKDIGYLADNNIRVFDNRGHQLDPYAIDWSNPGDITLRQDAGDDAALGQVAIRFPNPYSVYLHDTPHRELFETSQRAFSSGCIRVERPLELVELLFNDPEKWNRAAIEAYIATGETRNVNLPTPVPILLAYWTIDLLDDGSIGFKPDIYERDAALLKALEKPL